MAPKPFAYNVFLGLQTNTARPIRAGEARLARNFQFNRPNRCALRAGLMRVWATRTANAQTQAIFEHTTLAGVVAPITKCNGALELFSLTAATAKTSLETGLSTGGPADLTSALGNIYVADQNNGNLVSTGASGANNTLAIGLAAPGSNLSPTEVAAAAATAFTVGTYRVAYTFYNPTFSMESVPRAYESITKANASVGIRVTTPADPGSGYTTMRFYRTKLGEQGPYYRVGTSTTYASTFDFTVTDSDINGAPASYPKSAVHNDDGEIIAAVPAAAKFVCWHKGVNHLGRETTNSNPLRHYWSGVNDPSNFFVYTIARAPAYYHDLEPGQGRVFTGMSSFNGSLVLFKNASITVKNGDIDPSTWTWVVVVDGIGCIAPWTRAVAPGVGVFFCGADGIYLFDLARVHKISDKEDGSGIGDDYRALDFAYTETWTACWNEQTREYWVAVTSSGDTVPKTIYVYAADTGAWATIAVGMGNTAITAMGIITNAASLRRLYLGTSDGYALETGRATQADGPISGTITGTATAGAATTMTDSGAAFYTTGDGLTGLVLTVRHSATSYESRVISSNTATVITVASAWTTNPVAAERYFVGAIQGTLALGQWDGGNGYTKRFNKLAGQWVKQSHTVPVRLGWTMDDDTIPSYAGTEETMGDISFSTPMGDRGTECGPYVDLIGTSAPIELKRVELDASLLRAGYPTS